MPFQRPSSSTNMQISRGERGMECVEREPLLTEYNTRHNGVRLLNLSFHNTNKSIVIRHSLDNFFVLRGPNIPSSVSFIMLNVMFSSKMVMRLRRFRLFCSMIVDSTMSRHRVESSVFLNSLTITHTLTTRSLRTDNMSFICLLDAMLKD